jgi:hypothetical protein
MEHFATIASPEPTHAHVQQAIDTVQYLAQGNPPRNRLEAGLDVALAIGIDPSHERVVEERRFEMAYANALARNERAGPEAPSLSSHDWARSLLVEASIQREAEISLQLPAKEVQQRHQWGAPRVEAEHWAQAGVRPYLFREADGEELKAMAAGRMHELTGETAGRVEASVTAAMAPGSPLLEHTLVSAAAYRAHGTDLPKGREQVELVDAARFGPKPAGPDHEVMGGIADRMMLAQRAAAVGHRDARGLFDPTPGRNPFEVTPMHVERANRATIGFENSEFSRRVQLASRTMIALDGLAADPNRGARLHSAAARLLASGMNSQGDAKADVRTLMADVYLQRTAEDLLAGKDSGAAGRLEALVSGTPAGRDAVRLTTLPSERAETQAIAEGRFQDVSDARGLASGIRHSTWRAEMVGSSMIDRAIREEMQVMAKPIKAVSAAKGPGHGVSAVTRMAMAGRGGNGR